MSIEIIPAGAALGAEIRGVDLARPIDDEMFAAIERAYNDHGVIFFRDQHIAPPQQVAFTRQSVSPHQLLTNASPVPCCVQEFEVRSTRCWRPAAARGAPG